MFQKLKNYILFFLGSSVNAKTNLEINYPKLFGQSLTSSSTLPEYVAYIFNFTVVISGIIAVLLGLIAKANKNKN